MKIYTITHAINLTGDFAGNELDALTTFAKSYRTHEDATLALQDNIRELISYSVCGDDTQRVDEEYNNAIESEIELGNIFGRHNIREYTLELCDRVIVWSIFEQEI